LLHADGRTNRFMEITKLILIVVVALDIVASNISMKKVQKKTGIYFTVLEGR
jgi:hypothetical protein